MPEFLVTYGGCIADELCDHPGEALDTYLAQDRVEAPDEPSAIIEFNSAYGAKPEPGERYFVSALPLPYSTWNIDEHEAIVGGK